MDSSSSTRLRSQDMGLHLNRTHLQASYDLALPRLGSVAGTFRRWHHFANSSSELLPIFRPVLEVFNENRANIYSPLEVNAWMMAGAYDRIASELESKDPNQPLSEEEKNVVKKVSQQSKQSKKQVAEVAKEENKRLKGNTFLEESYELLKKYQDIPEIVAEGSEVLGVRGIIAKQARQVQAYWNGLFPLIERIKQKFSSNDAEKVADNMVENVMKVSEERNNQISSAGSQEQKERLVAEKNKEMEELRKDAHASASALQAAGHQKAANYVLATTHGLILLDKGISVVSKIAGSSILAGGSVGALGGPLGIGIGAAIGGIINFITARASEKRIIHSLKKHMKKQFVKLTASLQEEFKRMHQEMEVFHHNLAIVDQHIKTVHDNLLIVHDNLHIVQDNLLLHDERMHEQFKFVHARFDLIEEMLGKTTRMLLAEFLEVREELSSMHGNIDSLLRLTNEVLYDNYWRTKELSTKDYRKIRMEIAPNLTRREFRTRRKIREQWNFLRFWLIEQVSSRNFTGGSVAHLNPRETCMQVKTLGIESTINTIAASLFISNLAPLPNPIDWKEGVHTLVELLNSPEFILGVEERRDIEKIILIGEKYKQYILEIRGKLNIFATIFDDYRAQYHLAINVCCQAFLGEPVILDPPEFKKNIERCLSEIGKQASSPAKVLKPAEKKMQSVIYSFLRSQLRKVLNECQKEAKPKGQSGWYHDIFQSLPKKGSIFTVYPGNEQLVAQQSKISAVEWFLNLAEVTWEPVKASAPIVLEVQQAILGRALYELLGKSERIGMNFDDLKSIHSYFTKQNPGKMKNLNLNPQSAFLRPAINDLNFFSQILALWVQLGYMNELSLSKELNGHFASIQSGDDLVASLSKVFQENPLINLQKNATDILGHLDKLQAALETHVRRQQGKELSVKLLSYPIIDVAIKALEEVAQVYVRPSDISNRVLEAIQTFFQTGELQEIEDREYLLEILNYATVHMMEPLIEKCVERLKRLPGATVFKPSAKL